MIHIMGSSNGRTTGFDPVDLGSSPSSTATLSICTEMRIKYDVGYDKHFRVNH